MTSRNRTSLLIVGLGGAIGAVSGIVFSLAHNIPAAFVGHFLNATILGAIGLVIGAVASVLERVARQ